MDALNPVNQPGSDAANTSRIEPHCPGDHDMPYRFGLRPTVRAPFPFRDRQFGRLLILRGRVQDAPSAEDCRAA